MSSQRPLFDPTRIAGPETPAASQPMTVSQVTRLVKGAISRQLPGTLHVIGELGDISRPGSGHLYFTLKDAGSQLPCVMWRSALSGVKFDLREGLEVIVTGSIDVYEARGLYQLYARKIEPRGIGALELAFRQLREKLQKEGLFDPDHKKPLPQWPRRLAVVTSPSGAAIRDILKVIQRRYPCIEVYIYPVRVQGDGAAEEIAAAIKALNRCHRQLGGVDVIIVGRGGGSLEDLWAFNEEAVARAIYASRIPVVSAVGHEVDVTISDLAADVRAPTPSAAAEIVVPVLDDVLTMLDDYGDRLRREIRHVLEVSRSRLEAMERQEWFRDPLSRLSQYAQRVDDVSSRLNHAIARRLSAMREELHRCDALLATIRPEAALHRRQRMLDDLGRRLDWSLKQTGIDCERRLSVLADRLHAASPINRAHLASNTLNHVVQRLDQSLNHRIAILRQSADGLSARLDSVGYKQVLARGYSITRTANRRAIVTSPDQIRSGERIVTETSGGEIESRVLDAKQLELFE